MLEWMTGLAFVWALGMAIWWAKTREEERQARERAKIWRQRIWNR